MTRAYARYPQPDGDYVDIWKLTSDTEEILSRESEDIVFVTEDMDVRSEMESRYPTSDERLTRVVAAERYREHCWHGTPQEIGILRDEIFVLHHGRSSDTENIDVYALAEKLGKVQVDRYYAQQSPYLMWDGKKQTRVYPESWEHDCIIKQEDGKTYVVYDPKEVKRRRSRCISRDKRPTKARAMTVYKLSKYSEDMAHDINKSARLLEGSPSGTAWSLVQHFSNVLMHYDVLFGKLSHRRSEHFQKLMVEWRSRGARTRAAWTSRGVYYRDYWSKLFDWLDEEAKRKPPKQKLVIRKRTMKHLPFPGGCL